jgi:hypothetical protein
VMPKVGLRETHPNPGQRRSGVLRYTAKPTRRAGSAKVRRHRMDGLSTTVGHFWQRRFERGRRDYQSW